MIVFCARLDVSRCREADQGILKILKYVKWERKIPSEVVNAKQIPCVFSCLTQFHLEAAGSLLALAMCAAFLWFRLSLCWTYAGSCVPSSRLQRNKSFHNCWVTVQLSSLLGGYGLPDLPFIIVVLQSHPIPWLNSKNGVSMLGERCRSEGVKINWQNSGLENNSMCYETAAFWNSYSKMPSN